MACRGAAELLEGYSKLRRVGRFSGARSAHPSHIPTSHLDPASEPPVSAFRCTTPQQEETICWRTRSPVKKKSSISTSTLCYAAGVDARVVPPLFEARTEPARRLDVVATSSNAFGRGSPLVPRDAAHPSRRPFRPTSGVFALDGSFSSVFKCVRCPRLRSTTIVRAARPQRPPRGCTLQPRRVVGDDLKLDASWIMIPDA